MKLIEMIQCSDCKETLMEYIKKSPGLTEETIEHLEAFALFIELRRLRNKKEETTLTSPPGIRTFPADTIVC